MPKEGDRKRRADKPAEPAKETRRSGKSEKPAKETRRGGKPEKPAKETRHPAWVAKGSELKMPAETGIWVPSGSDIWNPTSPDVRKTETVGSVPRTPSPKGPDDPLTVTQEIQDLAERVAAEHWDMKVSAWTVMATKPEFGGAIWRIETSHGPRSFKLLHRPPARSMFSVGAQEYLVGRGARVPALVRTKTGEIAAVVDGRMFIVTDWITDLHPAPKELDGAMALCYGLAEFHRHSQDYRPPKGAANASRLARWPNTYRKMRNKITWFEHLARAYPEMLASPSILRATDLFLSQADQAIARLANSGYNELVAKGDQYWGLVHQGEGEQKERSCGIPWFRSDVSCLIRVTSCRPRLPSTYGGPPMTRARGRL